MKRLLTFVLLIVLLIMLGCLPAAELKVSPAISEKSDIDISDKSPKELALQHLREVMDRYHERLYVYSDLSSPGNHFVTLGMMGNLNAVTVSHTSENPYSGRTCIKNSFTGSDWGGCCFLNGILEGNDKVPRLNWGDSPNAGINLQGAKSLTFYARGARGDERVEFFVFGAGRKENGASFKPYPDSSPKISTGIITLTSNWQKYKLIFNDLDTSYVLAGFGWAVSQAQNKTVPVEFYLDEFYYDYKMLDEPRFLLSFDILPVKAVSYPKGCDPDSSALINAGLIYDNALALMAFLSDGKDDSFRRARLIADAFVYAIDHDRFFDDGRLRDGYQAGDMKLWPGWKPKGKEGTVRIPGFWLENNPTCRLLEHNPDCWLEDESSAMSRTGDVAWAMLALISMYEVFKEQIYLDTAMRLGEWVEIHSKDDKINGGYTGGWKGSDGNQARMQWKSVEHNFDLFAAFYRIHRHTNDMKWKYRAEHAKKFVDAMWNEAEGYFHTGTTDDGITPYNQKNQEHPVYPLDASTWTLSVFAPVSDSLERYERAIRKTEAECSIKDGIFSGFGFSQLSDGIWWEGTAQMVLAYRILKQDSLADKYLEQLRLAQKKSVNGNGKGLVATSRDCVATGFDWMYSRRLHIGATAWFVMAEDSYNPFWGTKIIH